LNAIPDARPVKAEDSDTSLWCKALASLTKGPVLEQVKPQQFGVGVSGGVEFYIHGFRIKFELAVINGVVQVIIKIDLVNAHNSFPRDLTQARLIELARSDPNLIPLAVASESILRAGNPIYMRSGETSTGFSFLCNSLMGGGQGNALTGQFFVINLDPALKSVEEMFPGVEIKAIQDDMALMGPPELVWDRTDDNGVVHKGALSALLDGLKARGLYANQDKFACLGTTPDACLGKPDWLKEPTSFTDRNGKLSQRLVALTFAITRSAKNRLFKLSSRTSSKVSAVRFTKLPLPSDLRAPTRTTLPATTPTSPGGIIGVPQTTLSLPIRFPKN